MIKIDLNCDLGEGVGNERLLMPLISSCNIACGGHSGDKGTMIQVARLAKEHHVLVGGHPSYPDRENFGRKTINISNNELKRSILAQIEGLHRELKSLGMGLHHIKPHGALYNNVAKDKELALVFLDAIGTYRKTTFLYVPYQSVVAEEALRLGFQIKYEAFADRHYHPDLSLVSRKEANALIHDPKEVLDHLLHMVKKGTVLTLSGMEVKIRADTYCIHGDSPSSLQILMYLSQQLPMNQILMRSE